MSGRASGAVRLIAALVIAGSAVSLWLGRGESEEASPAGTLALRRYVAGLGTAVRSAEDPPRRGTYVLLRDLRSRREVDALLSWVERGGRLVVADPGSGIPGALRARPDWLVGAREPEVLRPGCLAPEAAGVRTLAVAPADAAYSLPAGGVGCFPADSGVFLVTVARGEGSVVLLGGVSPFTNELLIRADNRLLAARLLAGHGPVVFGPPAPAGFGQGKGLWVSLPARAKAAAAGLVLAALLFALARGRRLGRPVEEEPLTVIPASQLAHAAAGLYRNARAAGHAGGLLRSAAAWRIARRLGLPSADPAEVAGALSADGRLGDAAGILDGPGPRDEEELVALGEELARFEAAAVKELR